MSNELVDLYFYGKIENISFGFIKDNLPNARASRFVIPDELVDNLFYESYSIIEKHLRDANNSCVEYSLVTDFFVMLDAVIPKVAIYIYRKNPDVELLIYFNIGDVQKGNLKDDVEFTKHWADNFCIEFGFDTFTCLKEEFDKEEEGYFFDNNGFGSSYYELINI